MEKMSSTRVEVPKSALIFGGASGTVKGKKVVITASSGKPFKHPYWDQLCLDLAGMVIPKDRLPILMAHDLNRPIGFFNSEDVFINGVLRIEGQLIDSDAANEFAQAARGGVPFEASVYAEPARIERVEEGGETEVNGFIFSGTGSVFRAWTLKEVSPCIFGRDPGTETSIFSFTDSDSMVELSLDQAESEDDELANRLFKLANNQRRIQSSDDIVGEDEILAQRLFDAAGSQS